MPTFPNQRKTLASAKPSRTPRDGTKVTENRGYCYLALFEAFNASSEKKLDVASIKARLGAFPLVRRVVGELYAHVTFDLFVPCVRRVSNTMFHVDEWRPPMLFSEVLAMTIFSSARIGADDRAHLQQQQLIRVQDLCKTAGLDRNTVLADAAKKCLSRALAAPDSELNAIFESFLPKSKSGFVSPYYLDVQQLASLQADYPELGVSGGGTIHHPHAYAAVATLCQEAIILKRMNYGSTTVPPRGYDAYAVDVGANYPRHAKAGRFDVHNCCPIITGRDSARDTTRALVMASLVSGGKLTAETALKYTDPASVPGKNLLRCANRAEQCTVTAPYMMFVHSQYDITLEQLGAMFDAHRTIKAYSVMNFVPDIFVASQGTVASLGLTYHKEGDDVVFSFVGDSSMNYRHNLNTLLRTYTAQHIISPSGVMYVCERVVRGGALFVEYTRCTMAPELQEEYFDFNFWDAAAEDVVYLTTWQYDHTRYAGSKMAVKGPAGFHRLIIGVDRAFFERVYVHCLRSGDTSFIINHVVSAASTFNTKMSINGANIRAVNRVGMDVFFDAVIAIYMIAYRTRWMGTKTLHHMIESEKGVRGDYKIGFLGAFKALWKILSSYTTGKLFESIAEVWNTFVGKCSELNSAGDLDVELLQSVRQIHFSDLLRYNAKYEGAYPALYDVRVDAIKFDVKDGMLQAISEVVRSKYSSDPADLPKRPAHVDGQHGNDHKDPGNVTGNTDSPKEGPQPGLTPNAPPAPRAPRVVGTPAAPMSNKTRNGVITEFHRTQSIKSEKNSSRLRAGRHEAYACTSVLVVKPTPPDGNCLFTSLGYFVNLTANEMRADLCGAVGDMELRYNRGRSTWGNTDCVTTFSSLYQKRVCVHMTVTDKKTHPTVTSEMYSAEGTTDMMHLDWRVVGDPKTKDHTGHVEVLTQPNDKRELPREAPTWKSVSHLFDTTRRLPHGSTDEYHGFPRHQELKALSLLGSADAATTRPASILELGAAPGTWTKLLLTYASARRAAIDVVSAPTGLEMAEEVLAEIESDDAYTLHQQDALTFLTATERKYDFVISDVATADSWATNSPQLDVLCAVVSRLNLGATLVLKLSNVFLDNSLDAIANCRRLFASVEVVKPAGSRLRNTEVYLICKAYGDPAGRTNPYSQRRLIIADILAHLDRLKAGETVVRDVVDEYSRLSFAFIEYTRDVTMEWDDPSDGEEESQSGPVPPAPPSLTPVQELYTLTYVEAQIAAAASRLAEDAGRPASSASARPASPTPSCTPSDVSTKSAPAAIPDLTKPNLPSTSPNDAGSSSPEPTPAGSPPTSSRASSDVSVETTGSPKPNPSCTLPNAAGSSNPESTPVCAPAERPEPNSPRTLPNAAGSSESDPAPARSPPTSSCASSDAGVETTCPPRPNPPCTLPNAAGSSGPEPTPSRGPAERPIRSKRSIPSFVFTPSVKTSLEPQPSLLSIGESAKVEASTTLGTNASPALSSAFLAENGLVMNLDDALFDAEHPWQSVAHHMQVYHKGSGLYERIMELGVYSDRLHYEYDEIISLLGPTACDFALPEPVALLVQPEGVACLTKAHSVSRLVDGSTVAVRVSDPGVPRLTAPGWHVQVHRCRSTPPTDVAVYYIYSQLPSRVVAGSWKHTMSQCLNAAVKGVAPYDPALLRAVLRTTAAGGCLSDLEAASKCDAHTELDKACLCCIYVATGDVQPPMVASWMRRKYHQIAARAKRIYLENGGAEALSLDEALPVYMHRERRDMSASGLRVDGSAIALKSYEPNQFIPAFTTGGQVINAMKPGTHKVSAGDQVAHVATYGAIAKQTVDFWGSKGRTRAAVTDAKGRHTTLSEVVGTSSRVTSTVTNVTSLPAPENRTVRDVAVNVSDAKFGCVSVHTSSPRAANVVVCQKLITYKTAGTQTAETGLAAYTVCTKKTSPDLPSASESGTTTLTSTTSTSVSITKRGDDFTSTTSTPTGITQFTETGPVAFTAALKARSDAVQRAKREAENFQPQATSSTIGGSVASKSVSTTGTDVAAPFSSGKKPASDTSNSRAPSSTVSSSSTSTSASTVGVGASTSSSSGKKQTSRTASLMAKLGLDDASSASTEAASAGQDSTNALLPDKTKRSKLQACKSAFKAVMQPSKAATPRQPAAEVCQSLPRGCKDTLAVGGTWTGYPHDCKLVLHLLLSCGKEFLATDSLAKRLKKERITECDVARRGYSRLEHTLELFHHHDVVHDFVLVTPAVGAEGVLKRFLSWLPEDVSRVAIESSADLADSALTELLRECDRPVTLVDGRTRRWAGVLHLLEPSKRLLPPVRRPLAFPKLSQVEMGYIPNPPWIAANTNLDRYRNAMIEYRYTTAHADQFNKLHFQKLQLDSKNGIPAGKTAEILAAGYGVYDQQTKSYLGQKVSRTYSHGYSVSKQEYVAWNETARQFNSTDRFILVGRNTELMLNSQISAQIAGVDVASQELPEIEWINGPPGCGKTHAIVHSANVSTDPLVGRDLILSMTSEGKTSIRAGLKKRLPSLTDRALQAHVRTVASLLVNGSAVKYDRVLMDEALMAHAGTIGFAVALTGTKKVLIIGDIHQIPYVDREHMCKLQYETPAVFADVTSVKEITYRCPMDVTYAISDLYPNLCTMSLVTVSVNQKPWSSNNTHVTKTVEGCLYLTHTQPDKDALIKAGYGKGAGSAVMTIHEAQGLTYAHVVCIRSQPKALAIYSRSEYALVAISRHTKSFVYYTDVDDALTKLIRKAQSKDPAALQIWNAPRLTAAKKKLTPLTAGGLLWEADTVLSPLANPTTGDYMAGLPEVSHAPLMPLAPERIAESSFRKLPKFRPNVDTDVAFLQTFYDDVMAEAITVEYKYDQMMMEMEDTYLVSTPITVDPLLGLPADRKYGKLRPLLRTNMRAEKQPSQKESLLGAIKRNLNAPLLRNAALSEEAIGELLFKNFERSAIDETKVAIYESYADDPININSQVVSVWLEKQPPSRRKQIVSDLPLHLRPFNKFEFMVKKDVKPQLTPDSMYSYPSVQTIVYNDASVNAVSCPIYNLLWERLLAVLDPRILVMTGMSPVEFEAEFNARLCPEVASVLRTLENDFSKYDKAQAGALRRLEHLVWTKLGLDPEIALIWDRSRRTSDVRDRKNGVSFVTEYQRKSGEATTFSGNTLVAMCVMLAVIDIDDIVLMLAAGDDTLIYLRPGTDFSDSSALVADLFNLECKLLECYEVPYFCSKFLISTPDWTYFVHDLLKFVTKLGRHDMSNYTHVENYRVSCVDTMRSLFNPVVAPGLTVGMQERYHSTFCDVTKVLAVLRTLCHDPKKFAALYLHDKGVILCNDPSASRLH